MSSNTRAAVLAVLCFTVAAAALAAAIWVMLGSRDVTDRLDHDVITVSGARGEFAAIKLAVRKAGVDFHKVVVNFHNGESQQVALAGHIDAGGESRVIDLEGGRRVIHSVEFWYDSSSLTGRHATIRLFARR